MQSVAQLICQAPAPCNPDAGDHWVPAAWLEQWATSEATPGPLDTQRLVCPHGRLAPAKLEEGKRVSMVLYEQLKVRINTHIHTHTHAEGLFHV
jgi:hypothetical protein